MSTRCNQCGGTIYGDQCGNCGHVSGGKHASSWNADVPVHKTPPLVNCPDCGQTSLFYNRLDGQQECLNGSCSYVRALNDGTA